MSKSVIGPKNTENSSNSVSAIDLVSSPVRFTKFNIDCSVNGKIGCNAPQDCAQSSEIGCYVCGETEFLVSCAVQPGCLNYFHPSCISSLDNHTPEQVCPEHQNSFAKNSLKSWFLANELNSNKALVNLVIGQRNSTGCHSNPEGKLFWFCICKQYFSNSSPKLPEPSSGLSMETALDSTSYISQLTTLTLESLNKVSSENKHKLSQLHNSLEESKNDLKTKPVDPILQVLSMPQTLKNSFIRNYEILQKKFVAYKLREYHSWQNDECMVCAVCDGGESPDDNLLVVCSRCQVPVHCRCYNIRSLSDAEWICDFCAKNTQKFPQSQQCFLCPIKGGAFILANNQHWVHVTCARYLIETSPKDSRKKKVDVLGINPEKFKLKCFSCNLKIGACVQCSHGRCITAFHVECRKDLLERNHHGEVWWLCPTHKVSILTHKIREEEERERNYIRSIAEIVWKTRENKNIQSRKQDSGKNGVGAEQKLEIRRKKKIESRKLKQIEKEKEKEKEQEKDKDKELQIKEIVTKKEGKRIKEKKSRKNSKKIQQELIDAKIERCKYVFEITEESVVVTALKQNTIVKRVQYFNETMISTLAKSTPEKKKTQEQIIELCDLPVKRSTSENNHHIRILSTSTSNFKIKIKIPESYFKEFPGKTSTTP